MVSARILHAVLAVALISPGPPRAQDSGTAFTLPEPDAGAWTEGESLTDPAPRPGAWTPWPTDDPVIWAADACLGFYLTRDPAVFAPAVPTRTDHDEGRDPRLYAARDDPPVRVTVFNWPDVFQCQTMRFPTLDKRPDPAALAAWVGARLTADQGWVPATDPRSKSAASDGIALRHDALGVTVRVYWFFEFMQVEVEADYHGPPIIFDDSFPY